MSGHGDAYTDEEMSGGPTGSVWQAPEKSAASLVAETAEQAVLVAEDAPENAPQSATVLEPKQGNYREIIAEKAASLRPESLQALQEMYRQAEAEKPEFDGIVSGIAQEVDGAPRLAKIKGVERAVEKIGMDYDGDATQIKDLLRATIIVETLDAAGGAIAHIFERFDVLPFGRRNLLDDSVSSLDGYRDAKFNVRAGNIVAEVQVSLPQMIEAKSQAHPLYEEMSTLSRQAGNRFSAEQAERLSVVRQKMQEIYNRAWEAVLEPHSMSKEAREISAPLRIAESNGNGRGSGLSQANTSNPPSAVGDSVTGMPSTSTNLVPEGKSDISISPLNETIEGKGNIVKKNAEPVRHDTGKVIERDPSDAPEMSRRAVLRPQEPPAPDSKAPRQQDVLDRLAKEWGVEVKRRKGADERISEQTPARTTPKRDERER